MKKYLIPTIIIAFATLMYSGRSISPKTGNPLIDGYDTPFGVPPFNKIKAAHYMPAFIKGFEEHNREIRAIINNPAAPDFENTIKALEYSGRLLTNVNRVFGSLSSANTNDTLQKINKELAPLSARHRDDISLNDTLFRRIKSVYDKR